MAALVDAARRAGVRDPRVLRVVDGVPRRAFLPFGVRHLADADRALALSGGQTTSQPSLVARAVEALRLRGTDRVLEVGTGGGWQTALLTHLAAEVVSVEQDDDLAAAARRRLCAPAAPVGSARLRLLVGDATQGLADEQPFDALLVSAAAPDVAPALVDLLVPGARVVAPLGRPGAQELVRLERDGDGLTRREVVCAVRFVPLTSGGAEPRER